MRPPGRAARAERAAWAVRVRRGEWTERMVRRAVAGIRCQVVSVPGLVTVFFSDRPVSSFEDARGCDLDAYAAWCRELLARGVYPPPSQFEAWFPSLAHTPEQIERTVQAAAAAFATLKEPSAGARARR